MAAAAAADQECQEEELLALQSIYDDGSLAVQGHEAITAFIPNRSAAPRLELRVALPSDYPAAAPPVFELFAPTLPAADAEELAAALVAMFIPGEVVLFTWLEFLREEWEQRAPPPPPPPPPADDPTAAAAALARASLGDLTARPKAQGRSEADAAARAAMAQVAATIVSGEPLTEKKSTFQAHLAPAHSAADVQAVLDCLLSNPKIRGASHPCMMAYRIARPDAAGSLLQDCDDDGESAAGGRLLHLLQLVGATDVVVVVSRWFGGVHLGPARFALITNAARQLLAQGGYIAEPGGGGKKGKKGPATR
jgi:hypothetical protein